METTVQLPRSEFIPTLAFQLMKLTMRIRDFFKAPGGKLDSFGIKPGDTVVDYGCGPGRYLRKASFLVGDTGKVYAVDIHDLAINCACKIGKKLKLSNIYPVKATGYFAPIQENKADIVYALDMFHMVSQPNRLLNELHRLLKPSGKLILEDGHQKRSKTLIKIEENGRWRIQSQNQKVMELVPLYK